MTTTAPVPFHFGPAALFGMYHPVPAPAARGAVLLCAPLGVDQIRTHRLYRQLAAALVDAGLAVLRFDYLGSGDSPGRSSEVDWAQCLADTVCAADELRRRSGLSRVMAFGSRLGGSLVLEAATPARLAHAVVWDAVLDGHNYVRGMDSLQQHMRSDPERFQPARSAADAAGQWLGFVISQRLHRQLAQLAIQPQWPAVDWLQSRPAPDSVTGNQPLPHGVRASTVPLTAPWEELDALDKTVLAPELVKSACRCLQKAA